MRRLGLLIVLCLPGHSAAAQPLLRWPEALGFVAVTGITFVTDASTATAFGLATSLAMETKNDLADVFPYGLAAGTALARMHVDKHGASDTVMGAGIGILAARLVRRHDRSAGAGTAMIVGSFTF